jgi:uncharacterized protein YsxB (DUF464 family)
MTTIKITKDTITISGHSGYEVLGRDVVCASISVAAYYLHLLTGTIVEEENGYYRFENVNKQTKAFRAFKQLMLELSSQYPSNVRVIEKG